MTSLQLASLVSFVTSLGSRKLEVHEIETLFSLVNVAPAVDVPQVHNLMNSMVNGRKIEAIKAHRILTNEGLLESKNAVESVMNKFRHD